MNRKIAKRVNSAGRMADKEIFASETLCDIMVKEKMIVRKILRTTLSILAVGLTAKVDAATDRRSLSNTHSIVDKEDLENGPENPGRRTGNFPRLATACS